MGERIQVHERWSFVICEDRAFSHHFEVYPFPSNFFISSVLSPFMRADKELQRSREVVDLFESKAANLTCVIFRVQDDGAYPLGLNYPPNAI